MGSLTFVLGVEPQVKELWASIFKCECEQLLAYRATNPGWRHTSVSFSPCTRARKPKQPHQKGTKSFANFRKSIATVPSTSGFSPARRPQQNTALPGPACILRELDFQHKLRAAPLKEGEGLPARDSTSAPEFARACALPSFSCTPAAMPKLLPSRFQDRGAALCCAELA